MMNETKNEMYSDEFALEMADRLSVGGWRVASAILRERVEETQRLKAENEQLQAQLSLDWEMISEHKVEIERLRTENERLRGEIWELRLTQLRSGVPTWKK